MPTRKSLCAKFPHVLHPVSNPGDSCVANRNPSVSTAAPVVVALLKPGTVQRSEYAIAVGDEIVSHRTGAPGPAGRIECDLRGWEETSLHDTGRRPEVGVQRRRIRVALEVVEPERRLHAKRDRYGTRHGPGAEYRFGGTHRMRRRRVQDEPITSGGERIRGTRYHAPRQSRWPCLRLSSRRGPRPGGREVQDTVRPVIATPERRRGVAVSVAVVPTPNDRSPVDTARVATLTGMRVVGASPERLHAISDDAQSSAPQRRTRCRGRTRRPRSDGMCGTPDRGVTRGSVRRACPARSSTPRNRKRMTRPHCESVGSVWGDLRDRTSTLPSARRDCVNVSRSR